MKQRTSEEIQKRLQREAARLITRFDELGIETIGHGKDTDKSYYLDLDCATESDELEVLTVVLNLDENFAYADLLIWIKYSAHDYRRIFSADDIATLIEIRQAA